MHVSLCPRRPARAFLGISQPEGGTCPLGFSHYWAFGLHYLLLLLVEFPVELVDAEQHIGKLFVLIVHFLFKLLDYIVLNP